MVSVVFVQVGGKVNVQLFKSEAAAKKYAGAQGEIGRLVKVV